MSVFVVRAFIKMRVALTDTRDLARKLAALERELTSRLDSHESAIGDVLQRIMALLEPPSASPVPPQKEMSFHTGIKPAKKSPSIDALLRRPRPIKARQNPPPSRAYRLARMPHPVGESACRST